MLPRRFYVQTWILQQTTLHTGCLTLSDFPETSMCLSLSLRTCGSGYLCMTFSLGIWRISNKRETWFPWVVPQQSKRCDKPLFHQQLQFGKGTYLSHGNLRQSDC